jgi:1-deoxy-D-xylulose-5-phosphate synthase
MAQAAKIKGENRNAIAVIGDGSMTAGMAFEALNNAGVQEDVDLLVVLNDNDMSISPPVGALNRYLARLMSGQFYAAAKNVGKSVLPARCWNWPSGWKNTRRAWWCPATMFEEFGFNYIGPIDGHDLDR